MDTYNPTNSINAQEWLALDEAKQIELVSNFHAEFVKDLPNDTLMVHSSIHVIVENQLAMKVDLIPETIAKLIRQGLDRHEAIHAIGAIISEDIFDVIKGNIEELSPTKYRRKLERITAKRWRKGQY